MRITISLRRDHYDRLVSCASRRGDPDVAVTVQAAVESFLETEHKRILAAAQSALGSLSSGAADRLEAKIADLRRWWR